MVIASIIEALSKLAWPLLIAYAFWKLLPAARNLIDSRDIKIKVGDFELTVQQATDQLNTNLEDLQEKISQLGGLLTKKPPN